MNWPAAIKRATAAAYVDMSEAAFEREVAKGRLPSGFMLGGKLHWHRAALDRARKRMDKVGTKRADATQVATDSANPQESVNR